MSAAPALPEIELERTPSRAAMAEFLSRDRLFAAYALADLDAEYAAQARWSLARRGDVSIAGALLMRETSFRPLFLEGDTQGVAALLRDAIREPRVIFSAAPEQRPAIEETYRLERAERMLRMVVDRATFAPHARVRVTRLRPEDLDEVIDLYGLASRSYFTPARLEHEIYFGAYDGGTLVAAAGTHVRSREFGVAAVGNVLTRAAYRSRGYARTCTSAVTETALDEHRDVVLNVRDDNAPAIAVYRRLGYRTHRTFVEGVGYRRAGWERVVQGLFGGGSS